MRTFQNTNINLNVLQQSQSSSPDCERAMTNIRLVTCCRRWFILQDWNWKLLRI